MRQYIRPSRPSMLLVGLSLASLAACGGEKRADTALDADSALGRDLAMAQRDSVQPQLQDVPTLPPAAAEPAPVAAPAPRPAAPRPRPAAPKPTATAPTVAQAAAPATPSAPVAVTGVVAAGTSLRFATNSKVCSNTITVGEKFTASLEEPVTATNGVVVPEGATGTFEVTDAKTAKNSNDQTSLTVKLISVTYAGRTYPMEATVQTASAQRVRSATTASDAKKVAGGAILGAIAGQVLGKNTKGTVIGAAAGAAAGTAAAAATANYDTCINAGAAISATLDAPVTVRPAPTP